MTTLKELALLVMLLTILTGCNVRRFAPPPFLVRISSELFSRKKLLKKDLVFIERFMEPSQ